MIILKFIGKAQLIRAPSCDGNRQPLFTERALQVYHIRMPSKVAPLNTAGKIGTSLNANENFYTKPTFLNEFMYLNNWKFL